MISLRPRGQRRKTVERLLIRRGQYRFIDGDERQLIREASLNIF